MSVHAVVPEWLVVDDEIEQPELGGILRGDFELWDCTWVSADGRESGVSLVGRGDYGRPVSELVGTARVPDGRDFGGFFIDTGEVLAYAYTGPYEAEDGPVPERPKPADGAVVAARGTLGFAPDYVTEGTFVPLRALDGRSDLETYLPAWRVVYLVRTALGDWHVALEPALP